MLTDVLITNNDARLGGGIFNYFGTADLTNVTFQKNFAAKGGGAMDGFSLTTMTNVTFSNNSASNSGGGFNSANSISTLTNVTFSGNAAIEGGAIYYAANDPTKSMTLKNTIIANSVEGGDCYIPEESDNDITSAGFNLISDNTCDDIFNHPSDWNEVDPLLGPLAANGGYAWSHVPQAGSPVIDKGQCLAHVSTDLRGIPRPQGPACDIGAVERKVLEDTVYLPMIVR